MPCSDNGWGEAVREDHRQQMSKEPNLYEKAEKLATDISNQVSKLEDYTNALHRRNDHLANLVCYVMRRVSDEVRDELLQFNEDLRVWWKDHLKFDKSEGR